MPLPVVFLQASESDASRFASMDASSSEFFHSAPRKVKLLSTPMLFDQCTTTVLGFSDLGNGKEMFTAGCVEGRTPWPLAPSSLPDAFGKAIHETFLPIALRALRELLEPVMHRASAGTQLVPELMAALERSDVEWYQESVLFARHYTALPADAAAPPEGGGLVNAHTDSGIVTVMFTSDMDADLAPMEFLQSDPKTQAKSWVPVLSSTAAKASASGIMPMVLCFLGEMVVPFVDFLVRRSTTLEEERREEICCILRRELSCMVGVHRVNRVAATAGTCFRSCRHTYPFQLRVPLSMLLGETGGFSHRMLMF